MCLDSASQVFWQECFTEASESVWVPFPLLVLLELCQLAHLQYWVLFDPSRTYPVPVCIPLYLLQLCEVGCADLQWHWSMLWPAPLSVCIGVGCLNAFRGLAWTTWSHWVCLWWFPVWLALPHSALCPALTDLSVPLLWGLVCSQWHWAPHVDATGRGGIVQYPLQP